MESIRIENLSFCYPAGCEKALDGINFTVHQGEFVLLCGRSGCGKTTLLRMLKSSLAPVGEQEGNICFGGKPLAECDDREQASGIGFVMQNPDNQIVTDKVWHELAFGLENLGYDQSEIRTRVSEMASFFGIQTWFYKKVTELSGGQKQLLNLASIMVMQPSVLVLDEPTSQLDPIAAGEFLKTLEKINRELGTTVLLTEHRLEEAFSVADRVIVMEEGKIIADASPREVGRILKEKNHAMYQAFPTPVRVHDCVTDSLPCPLTVREGRVWLEDYAKENVLQPGAVFKNKPLKNTEAVIEVKDARFRYEKDLPDAVKGLTLRVNRGEWFCLMGGNGTGKTTALSLLSGLNKPQGGSVTVKGQKISDIKNLYDGLLGVLPQNPQSVFVKKTVYLDLVEMLSEKKLTEKEKEAKVKAVSLLTHIENILESHPYDLSGGEQQRAAIAKILLTEPEILLLDEPTKGMDAPFKEEFAELLLSLLANGVTVVMVSHDIEFCAKYADRCALFFDGSITSVGTPREFFKGKSFYTTAANRMARTCLPDAVLAEDIILACGGKTEKKERPPQRLLLHKVEEKNEPKKEKKKKRPPARIIIGSLFAILFALTSLAFLTGIDILQLSKLNVLGLGGLQLIAIAEIAISMFCFFPPKKVENRAKSLPKSNKKPSKRSLLMALLTLIFIPLTIFFGLRFLGDRKYYVISLLIILETMLPFCLVFESRKPKARELIIISVLCALASVSRAAFFMLPEFKPVVCLVIIAGVAFGGETGFLVGAVSGFVSNFFFGQGPWTPWQMFALGVIGFLAGILFKKGFLRKTRTPLCIFGFLATFVIYGGIMNPASIIMVQNKITWEMVAIACAKGVPFDLIHAAGTVFFLWFLSEPMLEKLERMKAKYGLIEK